MPPTVTRLDIEEEVLRILAQLDPEASMVPIPLNGTISAVGTITAPSLALGTINVNRFDGRRIKVVEDATAVAYAVAVTVTGAHTSTITTLTVSSTTNIRSGDIIELGTTLEKVLVRAVATATTLIVTRGYQGTTATALVGGETVRYDPFGFVTAVDDAGLAADGVLTISPDFSAGGYAAGNFFLYPKGLAPELVIELINSVLENTDAPHIWFPSLVIDSDMESGLLTNWAAVGAPGTREFVTTAENILFGSRSLHLIAPVDTGAQSGTSAGTGGFDVTEKEQLLVSVHVRVTTGDLKVQLRASGVTIKEVLSLNERTWTEVLFRQSIPAPGAGNKVGILRFLGNPTAGSAEFYISPQVVVQSDRRRAYVVPSWWTRENQLLDTVYFPQGYSSDTRDSYVSLSRPEYLSCGVSFLRSDRDVNPFRVELANYESYPIAFLVQRPFAVLVGDSSTTVADKYFVAQKVVSNLFRNRADDRWKFWAAKAANRASTLGYGGRVLISGQPLVYI